jgi:hypothetical protein
VPDLVIFSFWFCFRLFEADEKNLLLLFLHFSLGGKMGRRACQGSFSFLFEGIKLWEGQTQITINSQFLVCHD